MSHSPLPIRKFPCPGCGADLDFDPSIGQLKCPYCSREEAVPQTAEAIQAHSYEEYFSGGQRTRLSRLAETAVELDCPDCGAGLIFEPPDVAGRCPFCAANLAVAQTRLASPTLSPAGIVPFQCDRATTRKQLQHWLNSRWLAPFGFSKSVQPDTLEGVYLPFWMYDFQTAAHYAGKRGKVYYRDGRQATRWTLVSGIVNCSFNDVVIPATPALSPQRLRALSPWAKDVPAPARNSFRSEFFSQLKDLRKSSRPISPKEQTASLLAEENQFNQQLRANLCTYSSAYLAGFKAQRYQMSLDAGFESAQNKVKDVIERSVREDIGGDRQKMFQCSNAHSAITFKLVLLPVWLYAYRYRGKQYQVAINGCSQKLQGDYPISTLKRSLVRLFPVAIAVLAPLVLFLLLRGILLILWGLLLICLKLLVIFSPLLPASLAIAVSLSPIAIAVIVLLLILRQLVRK